MRSKRDSCYISMWTRGVASYTRQVGRMASLTPRLWAFHPSTWSILFNALLCGIKKSILGIYASLVTEFRGVSLSVTLNSRFCFVQNFRKKRLFKEILIPKDVLWIVGIFCHQTLCNLRIQFMQTELSTRRNTNAYALGIRWQEVVSEKNNLNIFYMIERLPKIWP